MPLTLTITEGALPPGAEREASRRIADAFLRWHELAGHPVMTPNVTHHVQVVPKERAMAGGQPVVGAWIETRTPTFALSRREVQQGFFREATEIVRELSEGRLERERIWASAIHTVDGTWNLDGRPRTDEEILGALADG